MPILVHVREGLAVQSQEDGERSKIAGSQANGLTGGCV